MRKPDPRAVAALTLAFAVLYGVLVHRSSVDDDRSASSYLFAFGSVYLALMAIALTSRRRVVPIVLITLGVAAGGWLYRQQVWDPRWIYLAQHAGTFAALGLAFGLSLRPGATALVTRMARAVHGPLSPEMAHYTRQVTVAWACFCGVMAASSVSLFAGNWVWSWSVLINFLSFPLVALMFVVEYSVRRRRFPDFPHASLMAGLRAFRRLQRPESERASR